MSTLFMASMAHFSSMESKQDMVSPLAETAISLDFQATASF